MAPVCRADEKVNSINEDEELKKRGYNVTSVILGEGSYAKVRSAFSTNLDKKVALKIINKKKAPTDFRSKFLPRELEILARVRHENIVELYEIMQFAGKVYIAMEFAGHGDMLEYIKLRGALPENKARNFLRQMLSAIEYLHSVNVVHRDLKCENILLDSKNQIKVSDFGFSRTMVPVQLSETYCGSAAYAAPEILQGKPYDGRGYDMWSLGVILYIMVCGSMPYNDSNIKKMIRQQLEQKVHISPSKNVSVLCSDLINCILQADISVRFTPKDVWRHPWMITNSSVTRLLSESAGARPLPSTSPSTAPVTPRASCLTPAEGTSTNNNAQRSQASQLSDPSRVTMVTVVEPRRSSVGPSLSSCAISETSQVVVLRTPPRPDLSITPRGALERELCPTPENPNVLQPPAQVAALTREETTVSHMDLAHAPLI